MDKLHLKDLAFFGYHGALPEENTLGQIYRVSLVFELNTHPAAEADDLNQTIDYRRAIAIVREAITGSPRKLIETVADRIATRLLAELPLARAVTVLLTKPHPPVGIDFPGVTIEIRRERKHD